MYEPGAAPSGWTYGVPSSFKPGAAPTKGPELSVGTGASDRPELLPSPLRPSPISFAAPASRIPPMMIAERITIDRMRATVANHRLIVLCTRVPAPSCGDDWSGWLGVSNVCVAMSRLEERRVGKE